MALKFDIVESDRWFTNSDYAINVFVKQANGTTAQDVTGWSFSWMLKKRAADLDASAVLTKTTGAGITIIDAAAGHVRIAIAKADTDGTVQSKTYVHELKRTDSGFNVPVVNGLAVLRRSAHLS